MNGRRRLFCSGILAASMVVTGFRLARGEQEKVMEAPVKFEGGFETDRRDGGRPVVLIAAALGVSDDVFRKAFSGVTPAAGGREPEPEQVRKNKEALLRVLTP